MIKSFSSPFTRAIAAGFTLAFIAALCVFFILHAQHNTSEKISANQNARMMQVIKSSFKLRIICLRIFLNNGPRVQYFQSQTVFLR